MSLNLYYNKFLLFILISISFGKIVIPTSDFPISELLQKNNKAREYYQIDRNGLEYSVKGPAEIKIFSKKAFPKKTVNDLKEISFNIKVNNLNTESSNLKKIDYRTQSSSHPMHVYTYSSKDVIVLPSGNYTIKIQKKSIFDDPILVRVSRTGRKSRDIPKEELNLPNELLQKYKLKSVDNVLSPEYYLLNDNVPLLIDNLSGWLEFNLRGIHLSTVESPKIIRMTLLKNGKYNARYHVFCIPHPSTIISAKNKIPSKLNKIYIQSDSSNYLFHANNIESELLIRARRIIQ